MDTLERIRFLADLDRYLVMLKKLGPEPSVGQPSGESNGNMPVVFFVDSVSGNAANNGRSPDRAVVTIDAAVGLCTANRGDIIVCLPGHIETVTAVNGLDLDIAGITVIGVGNGVDRPTINLTTAVAASIRFNAVAVRMENILITGGFDNITRVIDINGVADCYLKDIEYRDVTGQCAIFLHARNNSDRLTIDGLKYLGDSAAGTTRALQLDGCDDLHLHNFYIYGNFSTSAVDFITTLSNRVWIHDGLVWTENAADLCFLDTITGSTGSFARLNLILQDNAANVTEAITGATFQIVDQNGIHVVNAVNEKAMLINWTETTDAP